MKNDRLLRSACTLILLAVSTFQALAASDIYPGAEWLDSDGVAINAHGGGVLWYDGVYYWYGEAKGPVTYRSPGVGWDCYRTDAGGVACYSSRDLCNWKFEGIVLEPDTVHSFSDIHPTMVIERPKVIYNEKNHQFVMWMHIDNHNYSKAAAGVAVADSPTGKFHFLGSIRPHGQDSRDITIFKDDDNKAYLAFSSEGNATLHMVLLDDDYLKPTANTSRLFIDQSREAPAIFKRNGKYYIITSGCTGWDPNEADCAVADNIMGPYVSIGNPCSGDDADKTFFAQSTFVLPLANSSDRYIAMFDKWNKRDLISSRYIWLPIDFSNDSVTIPWSNNWDPKAEE